MIRLTKHQHAALGQAGDKPPRVIDPVTQDEYVLISAALYNHLNSLLAGSGDWTADALAAATEVFAREGWGDPQMDIYSEEWAAEIEARASALDRGELQTIDAQEVIDRLRESLRKNEPGRAGEVE